MMKKKKIEHLFYNFMWRLYTAAKCFAIIIPVEIIFCKNDGILQAYWN